ncbi:MAG: recombination mediator RecR [Saprospiraceae bacterium]
MEFSSKLMEQAVDAFASLPGIGKKTALRLALHLINKNVEEVEQFSQSISDFKKNIKTCKSCFNLSDEEICFICNDAARKKEIVCVVESIRDVMAIESTGQYRGRYHILGGVIRPIEGIGPEQLHIESLIDRIDEEKVEEVILAISPTIEGETTSFYISKQLKGKDIKLSTIARGVSFGGELQYADELTLGRSIQTRIPVSYFNK